MSDKYRVTTNGETYRIEYNSPQQSFLGFHMYDDWRCFSPGTFYASKEEANKRKDQLELEWKRSNDVWKPV